MADALNTAGVSSAPPERLSGTGDIVLFKDDIEIFTDRRLPQYDKGMARAFAARRRNNTGEVPCYALICEPHITPRLELAGKVGGLMNRNLVRLVASGPLLWPQARAWRYVFVYESAGLGAPLVKMTDHPALGLRYDHVLKTVIRPMANLLQEFRDKDIFHGDIRPSNMFDGGDPATLENLVLGECLSAPAGSTQPMLFETVERSLCDPLARGPGSPSDDLYAFGVSLIMILRRHNALQGMSDEEILNEKMEQGSYAFLTNNERFTGGVPELLRGLLYDDGAQRWSIDDVMSWLDGQRLSPKQGARKIKASRSVNFNGARYYRPQLLARDLEKNPTEALQLIETGGLEQWIERSLEDTLLSERYTQVMDMMRTFGRGSGYADRMLSLVSIALDPTAPIRYRNLKVHPEGFAYALTEAAVLKKDLQPYAEMINHQIVPFWVNSNVDAQLDVASLISRFDNCRAFLRQSSIGYGIERCIYLLNPATHCLSEKLKSYFVRSPEDLMDVLEEISGLSNRPDLMIDRHIAAFLSVKDRRNIDQFGTELGASDIARRIVGNLKVLATIQQRSRLGAFPGISGWIADLLPPVYERFHDRDMRNKVKAKVEKLRGSGDLMKLVEALDNQAENKIDRDSFRHAFSRYSSLRAEYAQLESRLQSPDQFGAETGGEVAAIVSGVISGISILVLTFMFFAQRGTF